MATITIRNLDESVKRNLKVRAAMNGRSMEAEARVSLTELFGKEDERAQDEENIVTAIRRRFAGLDFEGIEIPPRTISHRPLPTFEP